MKKIKGHFCSPSHQKKSPTRYNFENHKNVGDKILLHVQVGIYLIYIPTKYEEY